MPLSPPPYLVPPTSYLVSPIRPMSYILPRPPLLPPQLKEEEARKKISSWANKKHLRQIPKRKQLEHAAETVRETMTSLVDLDVVLDAQDAASETEAGGGASSKEPAWSQTTDAMIDVLSQYCGLTGADKNVSLSAA